MSDLCPVSPHPRAEMLSEDEARNRILAQIEPLAAETVPLLLARDRFAAATQLAVQSLPAFDNSSMDGYALAFSGAPPDAALPAGTSCLVDGEQAAGPDLGLRVMPGHAIRIFTGAPIPAGTGCVVMQEDVERQGDTITLRESVEPGENIRRAGVDLARGQRLFSAGNRLTPQRLGLLASQGLREVAVVRLPRVGILATGDELRSPGQTLGPGEIYESNSVLLASLAQAAGAEVTVLERARDDRDDLDAKLARGLHDHDALVIAGGVSVGERDFVKERLTAAGVSLDLWRVRIQPGKPFLYGRAPGKSGIHQSAHVFGLPGNPVSAFVTFLLFVRPAILRLMGAGEVYLSLPTFPATTAVELVHRGDRPHYLRGVLDTKGSFHPSGRQESHALFGLSQSNALVRMEPGTTLSPGSPVRAFVWAV